MNMLRNVARPMSEGVQLLLVLFNMRLSTLLSNKPRSKGTIRSSLAPCTR